MSKDKSKGRRGSSSDMLLGEAFLKRLKKGKRRFYPPRLIKRHRCTKADSEIIFEAAKSVLDEGERITIRHLFYRLGPTGFNVLQKEEKEYDRLKYFLARWRKSGRIDYGCFIDNTRWHYGVKTFDDAHAALQNTVECYRKNLWVEQPYYVEIWTEKDAIASILTDAANSFGVKVFVARGFSSLTSLWSAANTFRYYQQRGKSNIVYYFGDLDPSGLAIDEDIKKKLAGFGVAVHFERVAVTRTQVRDLQLPTRPAKAKDTRAKNWTGGCVEIDTLPPRYLRELVESCITRHIEPRAWAKLKQTEELERDTLRQVLDRVA